MGHSWICYQPLHGNIFQHASSVDVRVLRAEYGLVLLLSCTRSLAGYLVVCTLQVLGGLFTSSPVAVGSVAAEASSGPAPVNAGFLMTGKLVAGPWTGDLERIKARAKQPDQIKIKSSHLAFKTSKITHFPSPLPPAAVTAAVEVCQGSTA